MADEPKTAVVAALLGNLALAVLFETMSFAIAFRALKKIQGRLTFRAFWRDNRDPTLPTVVLEDSAALVSIVVAASGLMLRQFTGADFWDGAASIVIGCLLIGIALLLGVENYSLLIGEAAPPAVERKILEIGPESLLVVLLVKFKDDLDVADIEAAVTRLRAAIVEELGDATKPRLVIVEPASRRPSRASRRRRAA